MARSFMIVQNKLRSRKKNTAHCRAQQQQQQQLVLLPTFVQVSFASDLSPNNPNRAHNNKTKKGSSTRAGQERAGQERAGQRSSPMYRVEINTPARRKQKQYKNENAHDTTASVDPCKPLPTTNTAVVAIGATLRYILLDIATIYCYNYSGFLSYGSVS